MGGIAEAHRAGVGVAGQPVGLPLGQPAFAHQAIHDLHVRQARRPPRAAANRAMPPPPRRHACIHQGKQRERRIAYPAVAVIPVAHAADVFRQRRRRRGDDAAAGRIGQPFQGDQRTHHRFVDRALKRSRAPTSHARTTSQARAPAALDRRAAPADATGHSSARTDIVPGVTVNIAQVLKSSPRRATGVRSTVMSGPATARTAPSVLRRHPGNRRAVAEAQDELHAQRNFTLVALTMRTSSDP